MKEVIKELPPLPPTVAFRYSQRLPMGKKPAPLMEMKGRGGQIFSVEVSLGWKSSGVDLLIETLHPGDSAEFFFNTRPGIPQIVVGKFCHHFTLKWEEEISFREITRFRTDDRHELADPQMVSITEKKGAVSLCISADALWGFAPAEFKELGFAYRIVSQEGKVENFPVDFPLEQHPDIWTIIILES